MKSQRMQEGQTGTMRNQTKNSRLATRLTQTQGPRSESDYNPLGNSNLNEESNEIFRITNAKIVATRLNKQSTLRKLPSKWEDSAENTQSMRPISRLPTQRDLAQSELQSSAVIIKRIQKKSSLGNLFTRTAGGANFTARTAFQNSRNTSDIRLMFGMKQNPTNNLKDLILQKVKRAQNTHESESSNGHMLAKMVTYRELTESDATGEVVSPNAAQSLQQIGESRTLFTLQAI